MKNTEDVLIGDLKTSFNRLDTIEKTEVLNDIISVFLNDLNNEYIKKKKIKNEK